MCGLPTCLALAEKRPCAALLLCRRARVTDGTSGILFDCDEGDCSVKSHVLRALLIDGDPDVLTLPPFLMGEDVAQTIANLKFLDTLLMAIENRDAASDREEAQLWLSSLPNL